jgi:hypothetical protein
MRHAVRPQPMRKRRNTVVLKPGGTGTSEG